MLSEPPLSERNPDGVGAPENSLHQNVAKLIVNTELK